MASIEKFLGKPKKVTIEGEEIDIYPLVVNDLDVVMKLSNKDPSTQAESMKTVLRKSLKRSFPDITDEQIENVQFKYIMDFLNAVFETSGLEVDKKKLEEMMVQ